MKNIFILLLFTFYANISFGQFNFNSIDNTSKPKRVIYQDTKRFIGSIWGNSLPIKIDDYEKGEILLEGMIQISIKPHNILSHEIDFFYTYQVKFLISENNYKMMLDNVKYSHCSSNRYSHCNLSPTTNYSTESECLSNQKFSELMGELREELHSVTWSYGTYMKKNNLGDYRPNNIVDVLNTQTDNQLYYASINMINSSNNHITANNLLLAGMTSIVTGSLLYAKNPKIGLTMFSIGGAFNLTSFILNYNAPKKMKRAGIAIKNYSRTIR